MAPTLALLEEIHHRHAFTWVFENFDVFLTGRNGLDAATLTRKLAPQTRGGWCYELNQWLSLALEDEGFSLRRLLARNALVPDRPRTHQIALVEVEGQAWVVDAGFGGQTPREPMLLHDGYERHHDGLPFRLEYRAPASSNPFEGPGEWVLLTRISSQWKDLYRFTLETAEPADFVVGNHYHLTNATSSFAETRFVTRCVPGGRQSLVDHSLKTFRNTIDGEILETQCEITQRDDYAETLARQFGVLLSNPELDRLWKLEPSVSRGSPPLELSR